MKEYCFDGKNYKNVYEKKNRKENVHACRVVMSACQRKRRRKTTFSAGKK